MEALVIANLIVIACIFALGFFFGPDDFGNASRFVFGIWAGWAAFCLSLLGWIIYVAVHFIGKYW